LIIDFDVAYIRELFQCDGQRLGNTVRSTIRCAVAVQINVRDPVLENQFAVTGKSVRNQSQTLIPLPFRRPLEEFLQDAAENVGRGENIAGDTGLEWRFPV
jgi:hypothetical protein